MSNPDAAASAAIPLTMMPSPSRSLWPNLTTTTTGGGSLFWGLQGAADYLSMPYFKEDVNTRRLNTLPRSRVEHMLNDPGWTKAVRTCASVCWSLPPKPTL